MKTGKVFVIHYWLGVRTEPGQLFFSQILHTSTEETCDDRLAARDRWQTSAQARTCY